jgi:hypothetical protein
MRFPAEGFQMENPNMDLSRDPELLLPLRGGHVKRSDRTSEVCTFSLHQPSWQSG